MRFQTSVKTSSLLMTFHLSCISKQPNILMDMWRHFISGSVYMIFYHSKWNFISVKMTASVMSFKCTCNLSAISNKSALNHFTSSKFFSNENLMPVWNFISVKMIIGIQTGLTFTSPKFMWTQVKSWLNTKLRFSTKMKSHTSLSWFYISCEHTLQVSSITIHFEMKFAFIFLPVRKIRREWYVACLKQKKNEYFIFSFFVFGKNFNEVVKKRRKLPKIKKVKIILDTMWIETLNTSLTKYVLFLITLQQILRKSKVSIKNTDQGWLKWVQHLYLTFPCHVGWNWTECWMQISIFWKGHSIFIFNIFLYCQSILLFSKWWRTRMLLWGSSKSLLIQMMKNLLKGKQEKGSKGGEKVATSKTYFRR